MKLSFLQSRSKIEIARLKDSYNELIAEASSFVNEIERGNFQVEISPKLAENDLGKALGSMKKHLIEISDHERKRNWLNTGLATFSDILRNKRSLSLHELANDILVNLIKYVDANQGAVFVAEDKSLRLVACYAYNRKKYLDKAIDFGEGLAGQCVLEKQSIYLKEVPPNYVKITSGLGEATPKSILITPLMVNDGVYGVIELASLSEFAQHQLDFVNKLSENIASTIKSANDSEQTIRLLNASQQQAEELRSQEEEMRQNMEEMQATQEEMKRKSDELARATTEMTGIMSGIDATMAAIEFFPDGTIVKANPNFLKTMGYALSEIERKHHSIFVSAQERETSEYTRFWSDLASGKSVTGVFKRVNKFGQSVWLNAIYNPILDSNGNVRKVVKFATDITAQQEMIAQTSGLLNGINATMATIEFTPDGTIVEANDNFLGVMKYSKAQIKGKHHRIFVSKAMAESDEYKSFWSKLADGHSVTGTFERINSANEVITLKAIYNPIKDSDGTVIKVVKFATDVSFQPKGKSLVDLA